MKLHTLSIEERALLLSMVAPASAGDLPGELLADALERRDPAAYRKLLAAELIDVGIPPQAPRWVWGYYAEHYLTYHVGQYDGAIIVELRRRLGEEFGIASLAQGVASDRVHRNITTITQRGWDALALTPGQLPRPGWA